MHARVVLLIGGFQLLQVAPVVVIVRLAFACTALVPQAPPTGSTGESWALWFEDREAGPRNTGPFYPMLLLLRPPPPAPPAPPSPNPRPELPAPNFRERHGEMGEGWSLVAVQCGGGGGAGGSTNKHINSGVDNREGERSSKGGSERMGVGGGSLVLKEHFRVGGGAKPCRKVWKLNHRLRADAT